ncbi:BnaA01g24600D [Brassica napus]|uniref:BnaA01g24600D protein n=2 Tax=Brassica TaxID=3705 RepID=A0A078HBS8_BRANA|nr:BnaA01g24600D [Brassica napus]
MTVVKQRDGTAPWV